MSKIVWIFYTINLYSQKLLNGSLNTYKYINTFKKIREKQSIGKGASRVKRCLTKGKKENQTEAEVWLPTFLTVEVYSYTHKFNFWKQVITMSNQVFLVLPASYFTFHYFGPTSKNNW